VDQVLLFSIFIYHIDLEMGCWDVYCFTCGLPCHGENSYMELAEETGDEYIINETKKLIKKFGYLNSNIFLTADDRIVRNCKETDCNISFVSPAGEYFTQIGYGHLYNMNMEYGIMPGIFIHTSCWNWIKKTYDVELKYSDLPIDAYQNSIASPVPGINFGPITEYWEQYFNYIRMIENDDMFMIDRNDPKNIARIKKIVTQYKLKRDPKRIGPNVSATFFKEGNIKIGNNKNFWTKKNGKWQEIKEKVVKKKYDIKNPSKQLMKYLNNIPYVGEYNKVPLFQSRPTYKKNKIKEGLE